MPPVTDAARRLSLESEILACFEAPRTDYRGRRVDRAGVASYLAVSRRRFALVVDTVLRLARPGSEVLEVGAAYGYSLLALRSHGFRVRGTDLERCLSTYAGALVKAGVPMEPWDLHTQPCPFPPASVDVVLASEVLEHLQMSLGGAVRALLTSLRPGGLLVCTTPNLLCLQNWRRLLRGENLAEPFADAASVVGGVVVDDRTHPREPTMGELVRAFTDNRCRVLQKSYFSPSERSRLKDLCYALLPSMDAHCLVAGVRE